MTTRTAVITGANSGLGLECARALLAGDETYHVVLAVRDAARGADAVTNLGVAQRCTVLPLDLASLASVRAFGELLGDAGLPPLHAVVCNAGLQVPSGTRLTEDGFEMTFGVNHLGHFALMQGLVPQLTRPARVVVVSSGTHDPKKFTGMPHPDYSSAEALAHPPADPEGTPNGRRRYTTSKLCNLLFAYELDRRLGRGGDGITVTSFDPGLMPGSGLARNYPPAMRLVSRYLFAALRVLPNVNGTRESGRRLAALVADPRFDGVSGAYFEGEKAIRSSVESYDESKALELWEASERLVARVRPS
ncbi:SDR family NAD(P)-dependent oxidoreductase [Mycobacterium sp. AT1]|uniref:SDR family NAD(P)-dependent oxidoreductase n=1 Tax=Mycobacterium sp. AT1 TaxID=1961706 RepID=UPI0009ACE6E6|nr:SDR family NAD(P)-dependent oxidoreductase [Mycobacterium sp. AT1]OPX05778.1 alanine-phosphoribitol ligase [Mycobacterium sp. AT1]